jgi:hypothetical protein
MLLQSVLRSNLHSSIRDLHSTMAEAPQTKSEPHVQGDSALKVGNASGDLLIQDDNHTSPNNKPFEQLEHFKHDPLEYHGPTIRVVKVRLSTDADGPVQCDIRVASIDSDYICLSYVWGSREPGN